MKRTRRTSVATTLMMSAALTLTSGPFVSGAGATTKEGVISGRVSECGPGPIVASPDPTSNGPKPLLVKVVRDGRTYASEIVTPTRVVPWTGAFSFMVPAGRYQVISSNRGVSQWVRVRAGERSVVTFPLVACPD